MSLSSSTGILVEGTEAERSGCHPSQPGSLKSLALFRGLHTGLLHSGYHWEYCELYRGL